MADTEETRYIPPVKGNKTTINILLMGETGVGKSTFINSFVNYLKFEKLSDAQDNFINMIPCSFTITDDNFEQIKVKIGSDSNESDIPGQSATQTCRSYEIVFEEKYVLRLIDTPGIGDTRGVGQDKQNLNDILNIISQYDELDAICILLKPNSSRLTPSFEYCIKELLCHLEKSASENIIFIMTNSRGTNFKPGETTTPLKEILNGIKASPPYVAVPFHKKSVFCVDSEPYRFLAAVKNGVECDIKDYEESWDRSVKECARLMKYIVGTDTEPGLKPHKVRDTICVNEARQMILAMNRPLLEAIQINERNKQLAKSHKDDLEKNGKDIDYLKDKQYIPYTDLEIEKLENYITVCGTNKCCKEYNVFGTKKYQYTTVCHDPCNCMMANLWQYTCKSVNWNGSCRECGCSSYRHLTINYRSKTVEKRKQIEIIKDKIELNELVLKLKEHIVSEIDDHINEINNELEIITEALAKFAIYLKNHAITPYNDAFERHLLLLIENENENKDSDQNVTKELQKVLENYRQQIKILEAYLNDTDDNFDVTTEEIFNYIEILNSLEMNGSRIRSAYEAVRSVSCQFSDSSLQKYVIDTVKMVATPLRSILAWWFLDVITEQ